MEGNRIGGIQPYGEKDGATPTYFHTKIRFEFYYLKTSVM